MNRIYIDLETLAQLFYLQNVREEKHRDLHYKNDPDLKQRVENEVTSTLSNLFGKIIGIAQMSHDIESYDIKRLREGASNRKDVYRTLNHLLSKE